MMMNTMRPVRPVRPNNGSVQNCEAFDRPPQREKRSLAMVYPVRQVFEDLYSPEEALCAGTLFKALDMPFHRGFRL